MKKESKLKKKHKELKETAKGRAILKLIYWGIFFFILFVFLGIMTLITPKRELPAPSPTPVENEPITPVEQEPIVEEFLSIETKESLNYILTLTTYDYNYTLTTNGVKYIYKGTKGPNEDIGYKESPTGIIKYVINNDGTFNETPNGLVPISNLYEDTGFDFAELINDVILSVEFKINKNHNCANYLYEGEFEGKKYQIELEKDTKEIKSINVTSDTFTYNLEYNIIKGGE